ncbi:peroxiredoxin-like family protein [Winogradskyella sp.]|uniref:peroxiredoxin-like family protein n=1 Tax=Winogradskyella sp. TaxID=1883156 RepID=UPI00261F0ABA|nr:peroxiredoxin-like family protein [Winogradskyella sp.]
MNLTEQLQAYANQSKSKLPQTSLETMQSAIDDLVASSILDSALRTGNKVPEISLPNATGSTINLNDILENNRVVLTFYRGGWCPYCNLELRAFQEVLPQIEAKGAKLIAISPETPDNSLTTSEKNNLSFEVLSDRNNLVAKSLGLVFQLPRSLQELYKTFGIDLDQNQDNTEQELPIAATYIIEQDGTISYDYLEEDYKLRADPSEVLTAL